MSLSVAPATTTGGAAATSLQNQEQDLGFVSGGLAALEGVSMYAHYFISLDAE